MKKIIKANQRKIAKKLYAPRYISKELFYSAIECINSEIKKPYKDHVTLEAMVIDGWSRGFDPDQTVEETAIMGFSIDIEKVKAAWATLDDQMDNKEILCLNL
jgi:hypothetical protein